MDFNNDSGTISNVYVISSPGGTVTFTDNVNISGGTINNIIVGGSNPTTGNFTDINLSGVLTSNIATGTAPFIVTSTTPVSNLTAANVVTNANLTGDVTSIGNATTLATINSNTGQWGDAGHIPQFTVNAKGLVTAVSNIATTAFSYPGSGIANSTGAAWGTSYNTSGSGNVVLSTNAVLTTPNLGTPSALVGTNITGTGTGFTSGNVVTNANLTGDVTSVGNATTLATVNSNTGQYGDSTHIPQYTVNGKGLIIASANLVIGTLNQNTTGSANNASYLGGVPAANYLVSGGPLGTPSSGVATNLTGTATGLTAGNVTTNANLTGDVTSVGNATTLATVNSNTGQWGDASHVAQHTVNAKGLITQSANITIPTTVQISGDMTSTGGTTSSNAVVTLNTVNSNTGQFGNATAIPQFVVNSKGLITSVSNVAVSIPSGSISVTGADLTMSGTTGTPITNATLATVNSNTGQWGDSTHIAQFTVNGKGLVTQAANVTIGTVATANNASYLGGNPAASYVPYTGATGNVNIGTNYFLGNGSQLTGLPSGGSMVYPGAGIPLSTGSAWSTSFNTTGSGSVVLSTGSSLGVVTALSLNGAIIGNATPAAGTFTTLTSTSTTSLGSTSAVALNSTPVGNATPSSGAFTTVSATSQITSTLATGTAPFSITSTTLVPNLNVATANIATNITGGTVGSLHYQSAANTTAMLGIGSTNQVLTVVGGLPSWQPAGAGSMIYPGAGIARSNGSAWLSSYATTGSGNVVLDISPTITTPNIGGLETWTFSQDQQKISLDTSPFRVGSNSLLASGSMFTLLGEAAMYYWTHNVAIDASGNFLGRDDTGPCTFWAYTESGYIKQYSAIQAAGGTIPTWVLENIYDTNSGNQYFTGNNTVTATGTTQGTAQLLTAMINNVSTVAAGTGVLLPTPLASGLIIAVLNNGANTLNVYPPIGSTIDSASANVAVQIVSGGTALYSSLSSTSWQTIKDNIVAGNNVTLTLGNGNTVISVTSLNSAPVGNVTPSTGAFTTVTTTGNVSIGSAGNLIIPYNTTVPPTPAANTMSVFGRSVANRAFLAVIGPSGLDYSLQPNLARNKIGYWNPPGNATTLPGVFGFTAPTTVGTATARNVATTNILTRMRRLGYVTTATTAGLLAQQYVGVAQFTTGDGAGNGGFTMIAHFGQASVVAAMRFFCGMSSNTGAATNVEPNTLTNAIGVGMISTDLTQWYLCYGGSAAQTAIPLGTGLGAPNSTTTAYELALFCSPNANGVVGYQVSNLGTGVTVSGTITPGTPGTQTPLNTTLLSFRIWSCNNATTGTVGYDLCSCYLETDN